MGERPPAPFFVGLATLLVPALLSGAGILAGLTDLGGLRPGLLPLVSAYPAFFLTSAGAGLLALRRRALWRAWCIVAASAWLAFYPGIAIASWTGSHGGPAQKLDSLQTLVALLPLMLLLNVAPYLPILLSPAARRWARGEPWRGHPNPHP